MGTSAIESIEIAIIRTSRFMHEDVAESSTLPFGKRRVQYSSTRARRTSVPLGLFVRYPLHAALLVSPQPLAVSTIVVLPRPELRLKSAFAR